MKTNYEAASVCCAPRTRRKQRERERSRFEETRRAKRVSPPAPLRFSPILVRTGAYVRVGRKTVDGFSNAHSIPPLGFLLLLLLILVLHLLTSRDP